MPGYQELRGVSAIQCGLQVRTSGASSHVVTRGSHSLLLLPSRSRKQVLPLVVEGYREAGVSLVPDRDADGFYSDPTGKLQVPVN